MSYKITLTSNLVRVSNRAIVPQHTESNAFMSNFISMAGIFIPWNFSAMFLMQRKLLCMLQPLMKALCAFINGARRNAKNFCYDFCACMDRVWPDVLDAFITILV